MQLPDLKRHRLTNKFSSEDDDDDDDDDDDLSTAATASF